MDGRTIPGCLADAAARWRDQPAVVDGGETESGERPRQCAAHHLADPQIDQARPREDEAPPPLAGELAAEAKRRNPSDSRNGRAISAELLRRKLRRFGAIQDERGAGDELVDFIFSDGKGLIRQEPEQVRALNRPWHWRV